MKDAIKLYGQDLKKGYHKTNNLLKKLENQINKRYDLIITKFPQYIDDTHKRIMSSNMSVDQKLEIIIKAEDNYVKANTNQIELF